MTYAHSAVSRARADAGFSMVETMIAMTLLALVLVSLAPMSMRAARGAMEANSATHATAAVAAEINRLDVLPFDSLVVGTACDTLATPPFPRIRCTTINNVSTQKKRIIVVVTPSGNLLLKPDTSIVDRTKTAKTNPLNMP